MNTAQAIEQAIPHGADDCFTEHDYTEETRQESVPCRPGKRHDFSRGFRARTLRGDRSYVCVHCGSVADVASSGRDNPFEATTGQLAQTTKAEREALNARPIAFHPAQDFRARLALLAEGNIPPNPKNLYFKDVLRAGEKRKRIEAVGFILPSDAPEPPAEESVGTWRDERQLIQIAPETWDLVPGATADACPGLCINRPSRDNRRKWHVSHLKSGKRILSAPTKKLAQLAAERLAPLADWTGDEATVLTVEGLAAKVHGVRRDLNL